MTSVTVRTESLRAGLLRPEHAADAIRLSTEAGWNQTVDDWRVMLRDGQGWGRFTQAGQLVATTLLLPYAQRLAWLAMVLVAERHRHQGVASALMKEALQRSDELGFTAGLDATPDGRRVYRTHGFKDLFGLQRFQCARPRPRPVEVGGVSLRELGSIDVKRVISLGCRGVRRGTARDHELPAERRTETRGGGQEHGTAGRVRARPSRSPGAAPGTGHREPR